MLTSSLSRNACPERERQTNVLPHPKNFTNVSGFSSLAQDVDELSCEIVLQCSRPKAQGQQRVDERGDGFSANSESKSSRNQRGSSPWKQSAHQVSYLAVSGGDSKGVHHVGSSGWRRASAIMDSGSAECVALEDIVRNTPLMETQASRQGQTYHTADG